MQNIIPIEVKKQCIKLSETMTAREVYLSYYSGLFDTSFESFRRNLNLWKSKVQADDVLLEAGNLGYNFVPHGATVQVNGEGKIVQSWIKSHTSEDMYMRLIDSIKENTPHEYIEIIPKTEAEGMLELDFFDMHFGIADIEHYKHTLENTINIIDKKIYEEINIIIGQDMLHNDNFNGTTTKGTPIEKVDMVRAWNDAKTFWYNIINRAIEQSNKIKITYSKGNHDKAMSWAFTQMLKERYGEEVVDDSLSQRKALVFGKCFIGITHGEFKKCKPSDLRSQFSIKYPMEFATCTTKEIHSGHLHRESEIDEYGVMCRRVSTGNMDDDWSDEEGFIGALKRFMVFEWSLDKLVAIYYV